MNIWPQYFIPTYFVDVTHGPGAVSVNQVVVVIILYVDNASNICEHAVLVCRGSLPRALN